MLTVTLILKVEFPYGSKRSQLLRRRVQLPTLPQAGDAVVCGPDRNLVQFVDYRKFMPGSEERIEVILEPLLFNSLAFDGQPKSWMLSPYGLAAWAEVGWEVVKPDDKALLPCHSKFNATPQQAPKRD